MATEHIENAKGKIETLLAGQGFKGCIVSVASDSELTVDLPGGRQAMGKPDEFDLAINRANELGAPLENAFADAGLLDDIG